MSGSYVRVYYSIRDDEKFARIYDDDHHLATWLRLLMAADAVWPASADLPAGARRSSVSALVDALLVQMVSPQRFRVSGLDKERERRSSAASNAAALRWHKNGNAVGNAEIMPRRDETSKDETRREVASPEQDEPYVVAYHAATGRAPSKLQRAKLYELVDRHSLDWLVTNLTGPDPLGHCFEVDSEWQRARRKDVAAEEAAWKRQKRLERVQSSRAEIAKEFFNPSDAA